MNKNKLKNIAIAILALLIVLTIGYKIINRKVDLTKDIVITYSGFNGGGTLSYNDKEIHKEIVEVIGKSNGLNDKEIKKIESGNDNNNKKVKMVTKQVNEVKVTFSETSNLKSGQKIKVIVSAPEDSPIKNKVQTVQVNKLNKVQKITANDLKNKLIFKESGYDGLGYINAVSKEIPDQVPLLVTNNGHLKNNGYAKITVPKATIQYLTEHGMELIGRPDFKVNVTDLIDLQDATNIDKVVSLNNKYAQIGDDNSNKDDRKLELIGTYVSTASESQKPSEVSETVTVNKNLLYNDSLSVFGLYKVTTGQKNSEATVNYEIYGFEGLSYKDNEINIYGKIPPQDGFFQALDGSEDEIIKQIKTYAKLLI